MRITALRVNRKDTETLTARDGRVCGETEKKAGRITLLALSVRDAIELGDWDRGLCVRRFSENITVDTLPVLEKGSTVLAGSLGLRITAAGKSCFPECDLVQEGSTCPLADRAYFAEITADGEAKIGDPVTVPEA